MAIDVLHRFGGAAHATPTSADDQGMRDRVGAIMDSLSDLPPGLDEEIQNEIGVILQLLPGIERVQPQRREMVLRNVELAIGALRASPPNRVLAMRIREDCEQQILSRRFFHAILPGSSAATWVVAGLFSLVAIVIPAGALIAWQVGVPSDTRIGGTSIHPVLMGVIALIGAVGSVISILIRIRDFSEQRILNPSALFWTGFFKPIIGASFALFIYTAFEADLLMVNTNVEKEFVYFTLAFIAGFSERFAPDLVSRIEQTVSVGNAPAPTGDTPKASTNQAKAPGKRESA